MIDGFAGDGGGQSLNFGCAKDVYIENNRFPIEKTDALDKEHPGSNRKTCASAEMFICHKIGELDHPCIGIQMISPGGFAEGLNAADGERGFLEGTIDDLYPFAVHGLHIAFAGENRKGASHGVAGTLIGSCELGLGWKKRSERVGAVFDFGLYIFINDLKLSGGHNIKILGLVFRCISNCIFYKNNITFF